MFILLSSTTYKSFVTGSCIKTVECESCGQGYSYEMTREAVGEDKSLFNWSEKTAFQKARKNAEENLKRILEQDQESVACPDCGWVQRSMIESVRKRSYRGLKVLASVGFFFGTVALIGTAILFICKGAAGRLEEMNTTIAMLLGLLICLPLLVPGLSCWALRQWLNSRFDPNHGVHFRDSQSGN